MQNRRLATLAAAAAAAALALALPLAAAAQATPEQVATQYLQTMKAGDWAGNAALVHPVEEDSLKAALLEVTSVDTSTAGLRPRPGLKQASGWKSWTGRVLSSRP